MARPPSGKDSWVRLASGAGAVAEPLGADCQRTAFECYTLKARWRWTRISNNKDDVVMLHRSRRLRR